MAWLNLFAFFSSVHIEFYRWKGVIYLEERARTSERRGCFGAVQGSSPLARECAQGEDRCLAVFVVIKIASIALLSLSVCLPVLPPYHSHTHNHELVCIIYYVREQHLKQQ